MSIVKHVEAAIIFVVLCLIGVWALKRWSTAPEPLALDEYEEAIRGNGSIGSEDRSN